MRVSEYFHLDRQQPELDFVDVDVRGDVRLFVDPRSLRLLDTEWGAECRFLLQRFFQSVLVALNEGNVRLARDILSQLREPNETHLGLSRGRAQGRALGRQSAINVADSLATSHAARTGLLQDLEDSALMVDGIAADIISDITTNVIRGPLINYMNAMASLYGIPTQEVASGPMWDPANSLWRNDHVSQPVADGRKILLVPKSIVRRTQDYDAKEYYDHYILEYLREQEFAQNGELVQILKNGRTRVTKKDLVSKYGTGKHAIVDLTTLYPEVLARYRAAKNASISRPLDHDEISEITGADPPDWETLLQAVLNVSPGPRGANDYHKAVEKLLSALFSSFLSFPQVEYPIHQRRKRIDIGYTNSAADGFFKWVGDFAPAPNVYVECKNYSRDPANPELDQLAGRFSPRRGRFGILVCRKLEEKELFIQRCRDTANDDRGFIIPLDDDDLQTLVTDAQRADIEPKSFPFLRGLYDQLIL